MRHEYLIIGAGPCGLSAARELVAAGRRPVVLDREGQAGGLASSFYDDAGFVWDRGAHVAFSYFGEFDQLIDEVMERDVLRHERSSYIVQGERRVPYPFQHNLAMLPAEIAAECMIDMIDRPDLAVDTYDDYLLANFGVGISEVFHRPYAQKLWTVPSTEMSAEWVAHRVATVDWQTALRNLVQGRAMPGWGPNSTFTYPGVGGIGEPFRRLAASLPDVRLDHPVARIDPDERVVQVESGERIGYQRMISTMPINRLVERITGCPDEVREAAGVLRHNQVLVVGIGARGTVEHGWHWLYFPEPEYQFYRITNMGLFSERNMPAPHDQHVAYMAEIALPADAPWPAREDAVRDTVDGLLRAGLLTHRSQVVSSHLLEVPMAYPIPTLDRTPALATVLEYLEEHQIYSRGRFGLWMYEYGNMDHAVKMGADLARHLLTGEPERVRLPHRQSQQIPSNAAF